MRRTRPDSDFQAVVAKGGLVCVNAIPKLLSDDPHQDIGVVLDHYDYLIKLLGPDHVAIGTDFKDQLGYYPEPLPHIGAWPVIEQGLAARGHA